MNLFAPSWLKRIPWNGVVVVAVAFFATRLMLGVVLYLSMVEIPIRSGDGLWRALPENILADGLIRWDSGFYRDLVHLGYTGFPNQSATVYFPLYPAIVWVVSTLIGDTYYAGLLVSNLAFLVGLGFLYAFAKIDYGEDTAARAVFYLAAAPPAFFFSAYYTESVFLMFILAAMFFARKQNWLLAAVAGALAAATRNTGVLIAIYIALEGYWQNGGKFFAIPFHWTDQLALLKNSLDIWRKSWRAVLAAAGSTLGLAAYMVYLKLQFNDPLAFIYQQSNWRREISANFLKTLYREVRYQIHFGGDFWSGQWMNVNAAQDVAAVGFFGILVLFVMIKMRPSLGIYTFLTFVIPLITGTFLSMRRYVIMLIPCFLLLAIWGKTSWVDRLILIVFLPMQAYFAILFSHWLFAG